MRLLLLLPILWLFMLLRVPTTHAAESIALPFAAGEAARIIHGYNGGTHHGASHHGLDLVLAGADSSGAPLEGLDLPASGAPNGNEHWGKTCAGWVYWTGVSVDPPSTAQSLSGGS